MRTRLSEHHFLTMVNDMGCWHLCSEIQDGCIMPDTSLLSLGEELVEIIPYYKAQNIFATMCQVITTPKKPFIHLELNDIIDAMKQNGSIWISVSSATGKNRAERVVLNALRSYSMPTFTKAQTIICQVYGTETTGLDEYETIVNTIKSAFNDTVVVKVGFATDEMLDLFKSRSIHIKLMAFGCSK